MNSEEKPNFLESQIGGDQPFNDSTQNNQINDPPLLTPNTGVHQYSMAEQIEYLERKQSNFIFLFGKPSMGKTAILASLVYYMSTCEHGRLEIVNDGQNKTDGDLFLKYVREKIGLNKRFPDRTDVGTSIEIDVRFLPNYKDRPDIALTFLEMAGEDFTKVERRKNDDSKLPDNIEVFFSANKLPILFVLVTSHVTARQDDEFMVTFIDFMVNKDSRFRNSKIMLLISQWDTFKGNPDMEIGSFVLRNMPLTYARMSADNSTIGSFSLGRIQNVDGRPYISEFDSKSPEKVIKWIYKTISGKSLIDVPWWKKVMKKFNV